MLDNIAVGAAVSEADKEGASFYWASEIAFRSLRCRRGKTIDSEEMCGFTSPLELFVSALPTAADPQKCQKC